MAEAASVTARVTCAVNENAKSHMAMMVWALGYAGNTVIVRVALNMGVTELIFSLYRNAVALLVLVPLAYFLEKNKQPPMKPSLFIQLAFLGLVGITLNQGFYIFGLDNTSATLTSATENSVPAVTFLVAVFLRIEKVHLKRRDGKAKVLGVLVSVTGALIVTLYKGPILYGSKSNASSNSSRSLLTLGDVKGDSWTVGCLYLLGHSLCRSAWLVLQAPLMKKYPARFSITSYTCFFGVLFFLVTALWFERKPQSWQIHSTGELLTVLYSGLVASGMAYAIQSWVIDREGPLFFAAYFPAQTILVAIIASVALGEEFYLGGVIGAVLIIIGLYLVLWGKFAESKLAVGEAMLSSITVEDEQSSPIKSSLTQPFLST